MLIYANTLYLEPAGGPGDVIRLVAKWVGQRTRGFVDEGRLAAGIRELKLKDGSTLVSKATGTLDDEQVYPYLFSALLSHRDDTVSGRKWITEVGIRQEAAGRPIECSILLKTDEVSARVFRRTCWHCHSTPEFAMGDGGPGNTGGFGFKGRGLNVASYTDIAAGSLDDAGERRSIFLPISDGMPRLIAHLLARHAELTGQPVPGVRGMPLGLPPLTLEQINLVDSWIAQGRPR